MKFNSAPKCPRCAKTVYMAEQIIGPGGPWHKRCLRCKTCDKSLDSTTLSERENEVYCKVCYNRLYGPKGWGAANMSTETQIHRFENSSSEEVNLRASPSPELPISSLRLSPEAPTLPPRSPASESVSRAPALPSRNKNLESTSNTPPLPPRNTTESRGSSNNPFSQDTRDAEPARSEVDISKIAKNFESKPTHAPSPSSSRLFPPRSTSPANHSSEKSVPAFLSGHGAKRSSTTATTFLSNANNHPRPAATGAPNTTTNNNVPTKSFSLHRTSHSFSGIGGPNKRFSNLGGGGDICPRCQKVVYAAESAMGAGVKYHKLCLRCSQCSKSLDSSNMREREGTLYCKPCYAKLYGPKGYGYGEGAAFLTTEGAV
ncbi:hypothetical protein K493DRAFT_340670 [Basidiobolus meristosporus CBS 931.73]|uniref:LIM zinc-binding domain-containing protein n=1 Tax=Basidiobolus meristosporus CBS 931.73 TaxID=1314790 RepID=A0A1Y1XUI3_9FUNG|nr:hypothetical protein K493DRAFT_340670 [Basidiobolus meristosporus CBS 931.73]|eukprot:ORX89408.1 hypothetical protein K493DRAFT_340670 [Basidiobolus meristosporus CBS 931.73]